MKTLIARRRWILVAITFILAGCSPESAENMVPPSGWTKETTEVPAKGIDVLFAGKRIERAGGESHLVVLHAPAMKTKQNARGTIGSFLDGFWKRDPKLFLAIKCSELEIAGRHALYLRISGDTLNPPQEANWQTYFFMTEAGLYQVTYSSQSQVIFRPDELLAQSFVIGSKESDFARDVTTEYIKALPQIQAKALEEPRK